MRLGVNLRGDLAKLDDAEIASTLESLLAEREAVYSAIGFASGNRWLYQKGFGMPFGRGPIHARIIYKIVGFLYGSDFRRPSLAELYVLDCEIKDVRDEIERRLKARKPKVA